jgi:peptide/nickel transport system substrate-binding protein
MVWADDPVQGGSLVLSSLTEPENLDPLVAENTVGVHVLDMIFSSLVQYGEGWEPTPGLADSWEVSDDGRMWTFHLRRGVLFHDGSELTAGDVAATYEVLADPESGSPFAALYGRIERFEAASRYIFRVYLRERILTGSLFDSSLTRQRPGRH